MHLESRLSEEVTAPKDREEEREREREAHWNNSIRLFNQRQPIINRVTTGGYRGGGALSREKREAWKKKEEPADEVATGLINGTER